MTHPLSGQVSHVHPFRKDDRTIAKRSRRSAALLALVLFFLIVPTSRAEDVQGADVSSVERLDPDAGKFAPDRATFHSYPIVPGTDAWAKLPGNDEMVNATQIPPRVLNTLSTEALVEAIHRYPLYGDFTAYNSLNEGFKNLAANFNGIRELIRRPDAAIHLKALYATMDSATPASYENLGEGSLRASFIEILLAQPEILGQLSAADREELLGLVRAKVFAKQGFPEVFGTESLRTGAWLAGRIVHAEHPNYFDVETRDFLHEGSLDDETSVDAILDTLPQVKALHAVTPLDYASKVYTPKGSAVTVTATTSELSADEIKSLNSYWDKRHPNAVRLRSASRRYNCHSYAWHSQSTSNTFWMNSPGDDKYWTDGSYYLLNYCPASNGKISYVYGDHSANIDSSGKIISKWGKAGVYRHTLKDCPYTSTKVNFYKKK